MGKYGEREKYDTISKMFKLYKGSNSEKEINFSVSPVNTGVPNHSWLT